MQIQQGIMIPIALVEPVMHLFDGISDVRLYPPVWSDKSDGRHLYLDLMFYGRLPGFYRSKIIREIDLVLQERINQLIADGLSTEEAAQKAIAPSLPSETDWRTYIARRLDDKERKRLIQGWAEPIAEAQKDLSRQADTLYLDGVSTEVLLTDEADDMEVSHLWVDEWVKPQIGKGPTLMQEVRNYAHKCLTSPKSRIYDMSARLRIETPEYEMTVGLDHIDGKPVILVQNTVTRFKLGKGVATFDGKLLLFYNVDEQKMSSEALNSMIGKKSGELMSTGNEDIDQRIILNASTTYKYDETVKLVIELQSHLVPVAEAFAMPLPTTG